VQIAGAADAPDPLRTYPDNYRVLLENDAVRVLDFQLAPGASEDFHRHPANVAVFIEPVNIRFMFPDGRSGSRVAQPGEVAYSDAVVHASQNLAATRAHGVLVELKAGSPVVVPAGAVTAVTLIHGLPGKAADLQAHLLSLTAATRVEPGCLVYDLYQSPDQPHEFMRYEVWASAAALEMHKLSPHLRASFTKRQSEGWTTQILTWNPVRP
jgi:quinol monooxygenase YgiN